jgi:hypothetical protein
VHQFFIVCDIEESLGLRLPASIHALKVDLGPACKSAFFTAPAQPSASQQQVSDTLRGMGLWMEDEFQCPKSGYSIDMRVQDKRADLGVGLAIEFDGPSHFLACKASVPSWEWDGLSGMDERRKYLEEANPTVRGIQQLRKNSIQTIRDISDVLRHIIKNVSERLD